ncbi:GIP, partial [Symbiodinium pilosum]
ADDGFGSGEEDGDHYEEDDGIPEEVAVAYATYQTAKQRYKEHQKARGFNSGGHDNRAEATVNGKNNEKATDKIKLMKAKSFCSGCGRRGHWHKDPECPHNQGSQMQGGGKAAEVGFCNLLPAEVFSIKHENTGLVGITDTACARTVAGTQWLQAYSDKLSTLGGRPELRRECEAYRFGTGKIYYSSFYVVLAFELGNKVVHVRTSIINGDVPLLLSKTVLGKLGMVFDIERGQADFSKVGLKGFDLLVTSSGHPAIPIIPSKMDGDPSMFRAEDLKLVPKCEYMAFAVAHGSGHVKNPDIYNFFYDKKLDPGVKAMLVQEKLSQEEFIAWWRSSSGSSDFWLECDNAWVRVHVTPRKALFNPSTWKTRATVQKEMLVQTAGEIRITDGVCCTTGRWLESVVDRWEHDKIYEPAFAFHWVGPCKPRPINHMTKTQLLEEAGRLGVLVHHSWSAIEIKAVIMEAREAQKERDPTERMKRISHMTLSELRMKANELGIDYSNSTTKGNLLRLIRDSLNTPDQELMKFGKFRGYQFCEIPKSYGEWVLREMSTSESPDPEFVRFGRWFRQKQTENENQGYVSKDTPPPYPSSTAATRKTSPTSLASGKDSWDMVTDKASASSTTSTRRRTRHDIEEDKKMDSEIDPKVAAEIEDLETKLAVLKDKARVPRGRVEDVGHGEEKGKVLTARPQGGEHPVVHGFGGRKCCPELSHDCFFTEEEFSNAYKNRNEICEIDFEGGNRIEVEDNEDVDLFHEAMEGEDDIEVFECKEFSIEDRITFAYDSGDFSFATCKEILDEGCEEALKGGGERKRVFHEASGQVAFGYYVHGGMNGVTKSVVNHTVLARYLNAFIRAHVGEHATWGAVSVIKGGAGKVHHDYNNAAGSTNYFASFGQGPGGKLWVHDDSIIEADIKEDKHGDIVWKQTGSGEWLPGRTVDANEKFVEFDPHTKHQAINVDSEAWRVVAYTPRGTEDAKPDIVKFLKNCGFPLPGRKRGGRAATCAKPSKRQRNSITNVVGKLSVLFTTLLTAANSFLGECTQTGVINDPIVILEIGGLDATLDATELDKAVLEPLSWEDYGDPGTRNRTLHLVKAVHGDLKELVREQLNGGGAVLLQGGDPGLVVEDTEHYIRYKKNHEGEEWTVLARPGTRSLELPTSLDPHHVLVVSEDSEKKDELPLRIDGSGITFEEGVPGHVRSALKRLHQNLGHPRGADLVRHLRLAGCESSVIKAAKGMKCQICDATKEPQVARPASLPRMLSFGEVVCADILYAHDCEDK